MVSFTDSNYLPKEVKEKGQTLSSITIDGEELEFSEDLLTCIL